MRLLLLASHAVAEHDDVRMFTDLGYDVFAPGGYEVPARSGEGIRPALPDAPHHPELVEACNRARAEYGDPGPLIDAAKGRLPDELIDWADAIIVHHFPDRWIAGQWDRISGKRVIWRTCGQSVPGLESYLSGFKGLQVVRYSPKEQPYFESEGAFAGQDALIRFGKYPDDYGPWVGWETVVGNVTQDMKQRGESCGYGNWLAATADLPTKPAGPGSEELPGGIGALDYYAMLDYLAGLRAYFYTGTAPASYTLGLMEAMLSGTPTVSIGPGVWYGPPALFEGHEITGHWSDSWEDANRRLRALLSDDYLAHEESKRMRERAIALFDVATVGQEWVEFLGSPR